MRRPQDILRGVARLCENELAASFVDCDRNPPAYDPATCSVTMPESFRASYQAFLDSEWWRMDIPVELGGHRGAAVAALGRGGDGLRRQPGGPHVLRVLLASPSCCGRWATPEQRKLAEHMVKGAWHATMVLTEPDAGSDVGAGRTKAVQQPDGTWHITGVKRFITSGESDLVDNIVHFVLARPEGAGPGTKGLSLFVVPKYHVDLETGALGARNGVYATNVEKKMGLKVSTTCELTFGERRTGSRHAAR